MQSIIEFESIRSKLMTSDPDITAGKMMTAPGIKYKGKVFAYLTKNKMGFKLGKGYDMTQHKIVHFNILSPFNDKPPLYAWFEVDVIHADHWWTLANIALDKMKSD